MMRALLVALSCEAALGQQQQAFGANGMPEPPSLTQTALNVFDKDHNGAVTLKEVRYLALLTITSFPPSRSLLFAGP